MIIMHLRCQTARDVQIVQRNFQPQTCRPAVHFVGPSYWSSGDYRTRAGSGDYRTRAGSASNFFIQSVFRHLPEGPKCVGIPVRHFPPQKKHFFLWKMSPKINQRLFTGFITFSKGKAVPLQAWSGPRGFQEVRVPRFHDNGTGWW